MVGMEAAAVSAVISGTLKIVGNKLAPLLIKQYSSIVGVMDDLQELSGLVQEINCWLETAGDKALESYPSFNWLKKLKDVSYDVDDLVDEFHLEAEKYEVNGHSGRHSVSKYLRTKPKSFMFQCKASHRLKAIKKRFAAIVKQRTDFSAIANSVPGVLPVQRTSKTTEGTPSSPNVDEALIIGRDQQKSQIISKLVETNDQQKIKIVSVTGLGGSGKTTLAQLVFNDVNIIEKCFEVRLWVHVSQDFDVDKLIKKLFDSFGHKDPGHHALPYMRKQISDRLSGKMFLLVLDDVWTESPTEWEQFMLHLKGGKPGSSILLTTRNSKVAETMGSTGTNKISLPFLSENDSWQLFQQSLIMDAKGLELEFVKVGKEIVKKCGGVPLAIKVLAGSLRDMELIEQWEAMRDNNLLDVEGEELRVSACLNLSYFNLPSYLKLCLTICSVFPKGHNIDKEQLIDLWIAHDMVTPLDGVDSLEYSGHKSFNSLVQMSFLQDVDEKYGRVRCRMHDLVHDLARKILGDEISHDLPQEAASSTYSCRYFSLNNQRQNLLPKNTFEKARAVYVQYSDIKFGKSLKNARHLRSIDVKLDYGNTTVLNTILQIKNLRYLCITRLRCQTLPEAVSDIWSLQALHVPSSGLLELPKSIGRLQKLRTLNLSFSMSLKGLPDSIGDCHMISTMDLCYCKGLTALPNSIERNKNLRVLKLCRTKIQRLPPGIITLGHLECLDLEYCTCLVELPNGMGNLKKLELLNLANCDKLASMPVGLEQLPRLQNLSIFVVGESETSVPISELGNIGGISRELVITNIAHVLEPDDSRKACLKQKTNLQSLILLWGRKPGSQMTDTANVENEEAILDGLEPPTGIEFLKIDGYSGGRFAQWMLNKADVRLQESPRFPCLARMELHGFPNLKHVEGLVELPCLEYLTLRKMPSLESISGGPFRSLVKLVMSDMPSLGEVWMVTERTTLADGKEGDCSSCCNPRRMGRVQIGTRLSDLSFRGCPKLKIKLYMPLSLEQLSLSSCSEQLLFSPSQGSSLFTDDVDFSSSFAFSHLKRVSLVRIEATTLPGFESECRWELLQYMTALESLNIGYCNGLTELPESMRSLTSLRSLRIDDCPALCKLPDRLGELPSLQQITISGCSSLSSLSPSIQHLTALQSLTIWNCSALLQLPEWLGELYSLQILRIGYLPNVSSLPQSLWNLTSLQKLELRGCDAIHQLPECLGDFRSLREFHINDLPGLTCLPQSMGRLASLRQLGIFDCPGIKALPEGIQGITALQELWILDCPDLERRCERGKGQDWHLISHIPTLHIGDSPP